MFEIGFSELTLIAIVALLVVGPERLPKLARSAGLLFGRARSYVMSVKAEIDNELYLEEAKRLAQKAESSSLHEFIEETAADVKEAVASVESSATKDDKANKDG